MKAVSFMKTNLNRSAKMFLHPKASFCALVCIALLALFSPSAMAGTYTSTTTGGAWNAGATWLGGAVPGSADDVVIATTGANQVTLNISTNVASLTINAGATFGMNNDNVNNRQLTLTGNLANNGTIALGTGAGSTPTARLTFTAAAHTWTGSGDISAVKVRMDLNAGGSLDVSGLTTPLKWRSGTGSHPFAVNGTLITGTQVLENNGNTSMTITFGASSSLVTANLNGICNGTVGTFNFSPAQIIWTAGAGVTFKGAGNQVTTGLPASMAKLTIDNPSGGTTLSAATTVTGTLTLTSGTLTTTAANLLTIGSTGSISGGSASSYVNGPLAQAYAATGSKTFPIGVSPNFRQVSLDITSLSGTPTITITPNEPSTFSCSAPSGYAVSGLRDWTVASSVAGPQTATLTVDGTGYSPYGAGQLIECVGGTGTALTTTVPSANNYQAAGISVVTSQGYALGEACDSTAPTLTSVSDGGTACNPVTVTWVAEVTNTYKIYRKTGAGSYSLLASGLTASPYNDSTAAGATTYTYAIAAVAPCGAESAKAEFDPITTTAGKPAAPVQPTVTTNCGSLTVNWSTVSGATSYNLYRKLSGGSYGAAIATGETGTSYLDTGASDSTQTYVYAVTGVDVCEGFLSPDSAGASPDSAPAISTPPTNVTRLIGTTGTFSVVATGAGLTYQWQISKDNGGTWNNAIEGTDGTGGTTASFTTVATTTSMNGYQYQCFISGTCPPSLTTAATTLSVAPYMRSAASGSSGDAINFEMSVDGSTGWVTANATPNSNCWVTVRSGYSLTNSSPNERQMRSLTIEAGGTFAESGNTTVRSLAIFDSLTNNGVLLGVGSTANHHLYFRGSGNWVGSGDLSTGAAGIDITVDSGVTLDASGLTTPIKLHATRTTPFTVNGTLNAGSLTINGNGNAANIFSLAPGATLVSANPNGLTGPSATLNFVTAPSLSTAANYTLNGSGAQASTGLPATVNNLTIANTAGVPLSQGVTVNGTLSVATSATLDFNSFTVATVNPPALNGALTMEVAKTGPNTFSGSKLTQTVSAPLTYGGTLTVTASGLTLTDGDSIPLFSAPGYAGGFSSVTGPTTPAGLTKDTSQLTSGTGGNITLACDGSPVTSAITGPGTVSANETAVHYSVTLTSGSSYAWTVPVGASITSGASGPDNNEIVVTFGTTSGNVSVVETTAVGCVGSPVSLAVTVQNLLPLPVTITDILGTTLTYSGGAGTKFVLLASPSVDALMSAWTPVDTNSATPGTFTIPAVGSSTQVFYRIQSE